MTVLTQSNWQRFHGSGSAGPFTWAWRFIDNSDVEVYRIDTPNEDNVSTEYRVLLKEGLDYTLTGAGTYNGGSLTLTTPLIGGKDLLVIRNTRLLQEVDLRNQGNNFLPEVHEDAFDTHVMMIQDREFYFSDLNDKIEGVERRAMKFPPTDDTDPTIAFMPSERANYLMGFDVEGRPARVSPELESGEYLVSPDPIAGALPQYDTDGELNATNIIHRVETIADLRGITGTTGRQAVRLLGYYAAGDGGGGPVRVWKDSGVSGTYVDNGGSIIVPTGGDGSAAWLWEYSGPNDVAWFGVFGPSDASENLRAAFVSSAGKVLIHSGGIIYADNVKIYANTTFCGVGKSSIIRKPYVTGNSIIVNNGYDTEPLYGADGNIIIDGIAFDDLADLDTVNTVGDCIGIGHAENVVIRNCHFLKHKFHGIDFSGVKNCEAYNNYCWYGKSSALQVDRAEAGSIPGIFADGTPSYNVTIRQNTIFSSCYDPDLPQGFVGGIHLHRDGHKYIYIDNNFIQGATQGIFGDPQVSYSNIYITRNTLLGKLPDGSTTKLHAGDHHFGIRMTGELSDSEISCNTIEDWETGGILSIFNSIGPVFSERLVVSENKVSRCKNLNPGASIYIGNHRYSKIINNYVYISDNSMTGIFADGLDRGAITGNTVIGTGPSGLVVGIQVENGAVVTNSLKVLGNTITLCGNPLYIREGTEIKLKNNAFKTVGAPFLNIGAGASVFNSDNVIYDSGWVSLNAGEEKVLTHNLGLQPKTTEVYVAADSSGSGMSLSECHPDSTGVYVTNLGIYTVSVRGGATAISSGLDSLGSYQQLIIDGYVRLVLSI